MKCVPLVSITAVLLTCSHAFVLDSFGGDHGRDPEPDVGSRHECDHLHEYQALKNRLQNHPCTSDTEIWTHLRTLSDASRPCLNYAVRSYAHSFSSTDHSCSCSSSFEKEVAKQFYDHTLTCLRYDPCIQLLGYFLEVPSQHEQTPCQSHHQIWQQLKDAGYKDRIDYQRDIVELLSNAFRGQESHDCTCHLGSNTPPPTTKATTTKATTTEATTQPPTTPAPTQPAVMSAPCRKFNAVSDIANTHQDQHPDAFMCGSGNKSSSEAYVLVNCPVSAPATWRKGVSVMSACSSIPLYTPLATFSNGDHNTVDFSGIFLGCISTGFKIASQTCTTPPLIQHIDVGGTGNSDPNNYFVINV